KVDAGKLEPEFSNPDGILVQLFLLQDKPPGKQSKENAFRLVKDGYMVVGDLSWVNKVVECKGRLVERGGKPSIFFTPFRVRYDKSHPNTVSHSAQMKRALLHPIPETTL